MIIPRLKKTLDTDFLFDIVHSMNDFKDMHSIFYAVGPAFKKGFVHPTFENINIYPLITNVLNLTPAKTDGKIENVEAMLK